MAKKATVQAVGTGDPNPWFKKFSGDMDKKFGRPPSPVVKYSLATPSTQLNCALGKGLPAGRLIELIGEEQAGKTATVSSWGSCVQQFGGLVWWADAEAKFDAALGEKLGLSFDSSVWRYDQPRCLEDWQQAFEVAVRAVAAAQEGQDSPTPAMFVLDSVAALGIKDLSAKEVLQTSLRPMSASQQWTHFFQRSTWKEVNGLHLYVVVINQLRDNPDMQRYGNMPRYKTPGGRALGYMQGIRIYTNAVKFCKTNDPWWEHWVEKDTAYGKSVAYGYNVDYIVEKNSFGAPWRRARIPFFFHRGFDDGLASLAYLKDLGVFRWTGGGYRLQDTLAGKTIPEVLNRTQQDPDFRALLQNVCCQVYQSCNTYEDQDFVI